MIEVYIMSGINLGIRSLTNIYRLLLEPLECLKLYCSYSITFISEFWRNGYNLGSNYL